MAVLKGIRRWILPGGVESPWVNFEVWLFVFLTAAVKGHARDRMPTFPRPVGQSKPYLPTLLLVKFLVIARSNEKS